MDIGIPLEIKPREARVALIPDAVAELVHHGHQVFVETNAGNLSGYSDDDYIKAGATISPDADTLFTSAKLIVKVKEPQAAELARLRKDHILFSYLHLAAAGKLMDELLQIGLTAIGFETVEHGRELPLLAPMSDIAGRLAVQLGSHYLHLPQGGRGILIGGIPTSERGNVVILGAGVAGGNAAAMAASMGANVTIFDPNRNKLAAMRQLGANVTGLHPFKASIHEAVINADLLVGAVLIPGARTPHLVNVDTVREMRNGSVIVDISVDQGGCIETTRPTDYNNPTFIWEGVVHFGVTNMPGAVPRTASQALSAALVPYILRLATAEWESDQELVSGINVRAGEICHPALRQI